MAVAFRPSFHVIRPTGIVNTMLVRQYVGGFLRSQ